MKAYTQTDITIRAGKSVPLVNKLVKRGVLPEGDLKFGRVTLYSSGLADQIVRWFETTYHPYKHDHPPFVAEKRSLAG